MAHIGPMKKGGGAKSEKIILGMYIKSTICNSCFRFFIGNNECFGVWTKHNS